MTYKPTDAAALIRCSTRTPARRSKWPFMVRMDGHIDIS